MAKFEKGNEWVKKAIAGKYEYNTGGADKKGKRPGFGKKGAVTSKHAQSMKGKVPTHGAEEMGETKPDAETGKGETQC